MLLELKNLRAHYFTRSGVVKAVDGVSFELDSNESIGLVGESGCGKTTIGFSILRQLQPPGRIVDGKIMYKGEDLLQKSDEAMRQIRGNRIAMIFQDPMTSLNPLIRVGDHIAETIAVHKRASKDEAWKETEDILVRLGIDRERAHEYPHQFSGGMRQRIMIALALALKPELIIADEPTTALDVIVRAQILRLLVDLKSSTQTFSWILITHDLSTVAQMCDKVVVMYAGQLAEVADVSSLYEYPLHPYTQSLLKSIPKLYTQDKRLDSIPGMLPDLKEPPQGCRYHPRCPNAQELCSRVEPSPIEVDPNHFVYCLIHK